MSVCRIILKNLENCDTVNHRLLILKGSLLDVSGQRIKTFTEVIVHSSSSSESISWPAENGYFTVLANLIEGDNFIIIEANECKHSIQVNLKSRIRGPDVLPVHVLWADDDGHLLWTADNNISPSSVLGRLDLASTLVQALLAEELRLHGSRHLSFRLKPSISIRITLSVEEANRLPPAELWSSLAKELADSPLDAPGRRFLVAAAFAEPQGAGRLALIPSALLGAIPTTLEELPDALIDCSPPPSCASPSGWTTTSRRAALAAALGAAAHELCHTFDLAHSPGLMSSSFPLFSLPLRPKITQPQLSPACAALLSAHPSFNDPCQPADPPTFQFTRRVIESSVGLRVVQLRSSDGVVVRSWQLSGSRQMILPLPPRPLVNSQLSLFIIDICGNISRFLIPGQSAVLKSLKLSNEHITCGTLTQLNN